MGEHYGAVSHLQILAPELTDRMLADFLDIDAPVTVTLHIKSIDQSEAIKAVKRKLSDLDAMKIAEQKKAVRAGYDMDIIPSDLATYGAEAKTLLEDLQSRNERMFLVTIIILNTAKKKSKLDNDIFAAAGNSLDRPAMNALTADIRAGKIGAVLVTDISRIARTLPLVSEWRKLLFEHGVKLVIPTSGETPRPAIEITYIPAGDYLFYPN